MIQDIVNKLLNSFTNTTVIREPIYMPLSFKIKLPHIKETMKQKNWNKLNDQQKIKYIELKYAVNIEEAKKAIFDCCNFLDLIEQYLFRKNENYRKILIQNAHDRMLKIFGSSKNKNSKKTTKTKKQLGNQEDSISGIIKDIDIEKLVLLTSSQNIKAKNPYHYSINKEDKVTYAYDYLTKSNKVEIDQIEAQLFLSLLNGSLAEMPEGSQTNMEIYLRPLINKLESITK